MKIKFTLLLTILFVFISKSDLISQEIKKLAEPTRVGVVDMQKILNQSKAYQGVVEQFEDIRRKYRNTMTKKEDSLRDEENNIFKQKNIISKEAYSEKVRALSAKIDNLKNEKNQEVKKYEMAFEKATRKIQNGLVDVLSVIANDQDLDLVLAKNQVLLVGKDIDLTDLCIKELNSVLPSIKFELPK